MVKSRKPTSRRRVSSQVKPNKSVELEWDDAGLDSRLYIEEFWQEDNIIDGLGLRSVLAENVQATKLYQEVAGVVNTNPENRGPLLSALPKQLKSDVKNFAISVDIFKAISKDAVDLAKRVWGKILWALGKIIKTIGKYVNSKTIEGKGDSLVKISKEKLEATKSVRHHTQALVGRRNALKPGRTV